MMRTKAALRRVARIALTTASAALLAGAIFASTPSGGTVSPSSSTLTWTGGPFVASNPLSCRDAELTCDHFALTVVPPNKSFVLTVRVTASSIGDDIDLFVRDPNNNTIASSTTSSGVEEVVISNPAAGTYTVVVQPSLVVPGATYSGFAGIGSPPRDIMSNSYNGVVFTSNFTGVPSATPAKSPPLVPNLKVSFNPVGRQAAEPSTGVDKNNNGFMTAGAFDSVIGVPGVTTLARTVVMRSSDKGKSWQAVSPPLNLGVVNTTDPDFTLDPYLHVDPVTSRVFSFDLNLVCGGEEIFSDDEGVSWQSRQVCTVPVNDHQSLITAPPGQGLAQPTGSYPRMVYYCFNQVGDSACARSTDGGTTFVKTATPAFLGSDPGTTGSVCGGLTGQLAADSKGRIYLPTGNCGLPWVAFSDDGGDSWTRVNISSLTPMADHEVSLAVDSADNIYAVWQDGTFRLPFFSVSTNRGVSWSQAIMMAPPGVHEVNFPTIAAGDPGRVAFLFPGSQSQNFSDPTRPWNIYIVASVNGLDANPTFTWTTANDPSNPVHRGDCGPGRCESQNGGNMFDFLDIQVSLVDGAFWGTASKTCVSNSVPSLNCVTNPQAPGISPGQGFSIREVKGPPLFLNR